MDIISWKSIGGVGNAMRRQEHCKSVKNIPTAMPLPLNPTGVLENTGWFAAVQQQDFGHLGEIPDTTIIKLILIS
jgi:hypothetical protein